MGTRRVREFVDEVIRIDSRPPALRDRTAHGVGPPGHISLAILRSFRDGSFWQPHGRVGTLTTRVTFQEVGDGVSPGTLTRVRDRAGVHRYQTVCCVATVFGGVPYLWVLWDLLNGSINPLRVNPEALLPPYGSIPIYDVQARAMMHGHFWLPKGSIGGEAFVVNGHEYTYLGIFPSLLRIPVFLFTSSLDGRFFGLSMFGAWIATAVFCSLLLWRLRILLRGDAPLGWFEAASNGLLLVSILVGSVLLYLASRPDAFNEDEAWSVALACASLFALVGFIERPSWRRIVPCAVLVLITNLNRSTTGWAMILATLLLAGWFGLGRAGREQRSWGLPLMVGGLVPLAIGFAISVAKFGQLSVPFADQLIYKQHGLARINGGEYISLHWLPDTLHQYLDPSNFRLTSVFPYVLLPSLPSGSANLFDADATANVPLSVPLLFVLGCWGAISTLGTSSIQVVSRAYRGLRLLLIASASAAVSILVFGYIYERYTADFMPLLILGSMIGMIEVWRRADRAPKRIRSLVLGLAGALAMFGLWANIGFALTPTVRWNTTQASHYVTIQKALSDITGRPLDDKLVVGDQFPESVVSGTLFIQGHCKALYLATRTLVKSPFLVHFWLLQVELAPRTPICDALLREP